MELVKPGPGRPPKYGRPSRAVTITLPEDVIRRLQAIDPDLGRAVVSVVERRTPASPRRTRSTELSTFGSRAVILVMPLKSIKRLPGVQLVPVANGRALISLEAPESVAELELYVRDALARPDVDSDEQRALEELGSILTDARQSARVAIKTRTIIVLEPKRRRRARDRD